MDLLNEAHEFMDRNEAIKDGMFLVVELEASNEDDLMVFIDSNSFLMFNFKVDSFVSLSRYFRICLHFNKPRLEGQH